MIVVGAGEYNTSYMYFVEAFGGGIKALVNMSLQEEKRKILSIGRENKKETHTF